MGIHKEGSTIKLENYGDFIYPAINIIKEDIRKKRDKGKYINGKYIWEDNKYYIGEFKKIYQMEKELNIIQMEIFYMMVIL